MGRQMNGADLPTLTRRFWLDWGRIRSGIAHCSGLVLRAEAPPVPRRRIAARMPHRHSTSPSTWGPFTTLMGRMRRRLRCGGVSADAQQRAFRRLLRSPARSLLRDGSDDVASAVALTIEQGAHDPSGASPMGEVVLAGAGPGDPELLTIGARAILADADIVFHDALVAPEVLRMCGPQTLLVDAGKRSGRRSATQADINDAMITAARAGHLVVRLKGGDPFLFGRGGEEVAALRRAGVPVRVIPGVSAALAAPAAAGIPVTHRGVAASVAVVTGHRAGGDLSHLEGLARSVDTLVVLMPAELEEIAQRLAAVVGPGRPAALVSNATTAAQRVIRAPLGGIAAAARTAQVEPPSTLVVGEVVDVLSKAWGASLDEAAVPAGALASPG